MLFLEALRNVGRRKVRSALTIFGIVIGVFAITVMGGISEFLNKQIDGAVRIAGSTIDIQPAGDEPDRRLTMGMVRRLQRVEGVRAAFRTINDQLERSSGFGPGLAVFGIAPEFAPIYLNGVELTAGRWLQRGDTYQTVIGSNVASTKHVGVGDAIEWREERFTVVGIMERTETFPDQGAVIPFDTVRREMRLSRDVVGQVFVVPASPADAEAVVARINEQVPGVAARSPRSQIAEIRQGMLIFNAIILSGAVIAGIVGGLSVVNTMVMAVRERTREIGLKKAIGASD
ncbi:MAG: ABC transporter permease, partial [Chloroflexota bacterium]